MIHHFKSTYVTVLQKGIHVGFVKKIIRDSPDTDKHMKTHVPIRETFTCHWCGCQCMTGKHLEIHIEQVHADFL